MDDEEEIRPPLLRLPTEILQHVAEFADRSSLKALRFTCRDTAAKVLDVYTRVLFTHVAFFMQCPVDLQLALQIVSHPVFGQSVRRITWMVEEVAEPSASTAMQNFQMDHLVRQMKSWHEQREMRAKGQDEKLLREVFAKLKELGKLEEVAICDTLGSGSKPVSLLDSTGSDAKFGTELNSPKPVDLKPFERIVDAFRNTDLGVSSFKIVVDEWCLPAHLLGKDREMLSKAQSFFNKLERIELRLWSEPDRANTKAFIKVLSSAPKLKHLDLQVFDSDALAKYEINAYFFATLLFKENFNTLEALSLAGVFIQINEFLPFIMRHKQRVLRRVNLNTLSVIGLEDLEEEKEDRDEDDAKGNARSERRLRKLLDLPGKCEHVEFEAV